MTQKTFHAAFILENKVLFVLFVCLTENVVNSVTAVRTGRGGGGGKTQVVTLVLLLTSNCEFQKEAEVAVASP